MISVAATIKCQKFGNVTLEWTRSRFMVGMSDAILFGRCDLGQYIIHIYCMKGWMVISYLYSESRYEYIAQGWLVKVESNSIYLFIPNAIHVEASYYVQNPDWQVLHPSSPKRPEKKKTVGMQAYRGNHLFNQVWQKRNHQKGNKNEKNRKCAKKNIENQKIR